MKFQVHNSWLSPVERVCSPNFNERPCDDNISLLVIHNISLPPKQFGSQDICSFFTNCLDHSAHPFFETIKGVQVSSHLLIRRTGEVVQFVPFNKRAWHAGASLFEGQENCNDFSIGIELEGADDIPYESMQYEVLVDVTKAIMLAYPKVTHDRITGHEHIAPGRKTDPGSAFDWSKYLASIDVPGS